MEGKTLEKNEEGLGEDINNVHIICQSLKHILFTADYQWLLFLQRDLRTAENYLGFSEAMVSIFLLKTILLDLL